jgi:hypothetical protein
MNLGLDDHGAAAERLGMGSGLISGERNEAPGHGDAVTGQDRFALVFVNLHAGSKSIKARTIFAGLPTRQIECPVEIAS